MTDKVTIIGGGLAGSAAALQLATMGIKSDLFEMRPKKMTPAHVSGNLAELVCSNSLGSLHTFTANGLLMVELDLIECRLLEIAKRSAVPAGQALAVDREMFSSLVTQTLENDPNIRLIREEIESIPNDSITILASGPLTSDNLISDIKRITGDEGLYFFDATSPTVTLDSIDMSRAFWANRRDPESSDYLNCQLTVDEFNVFHKALINAERVEIKDFEPDKFFESCLPIEILALRDSEAMRFGPMKPVGLKNPATGKGEYAIVQLRHEDKNGERLNMVGFQTRLKYSEQKRVFRMIPALRNAKFVRFGHMHRNFYVDAPKHLDSLLRLKTAQNIYLAGQITGGEGYLEAIAQGTIAGINAGRQLIRKEPLIFPNETILGSFSKSLLESESDIFQPMKVNFGMFPDLGQRIRNKRLRRDKLVDRSLSKLRKFLAENMINPLQ